MRCLNGIMIGHKDISMTDRYSHLSALHKKKLQDALAERYKNCDPTDFPLISTFEQKQ